MIGIFCYYSPPSGLAPEGSCESVGGDEKVTVEEDRYSLFSLRSDLYYSPPELLAAKGS